MSLKAYFFFGDQYARYDIQTDKIDNGYPLPIQGNWPGMPFSRIDSALVWNNNKAYFFCGNMYARYDIQTDKIDDGYPLPIQGNWPGMPFTIIDAAVLWNNEKAYFFSGNQYARYDVTTDKIDDGYPLPIQGNWPGMPFNKIESALLWNNGKAYFFSGTQYVRYDVAADKVDDGYPLPIQGNWTGMPFSTIDAAVLWTSSAPLNLSSLLYEEKVTENRGLFGAKVRDICNRLSINPDWLMGLMHHESGLNHRIQNSVGATGLIQFMPETATALGTTTASLIAMSNVEQLEFVYKYFSPYKGRMNRYSDLYLVGFYPIALGKPDDFIIGSERSLEHAKRIRDQNVPVDVDNDGFITIDDFRKWALRGIPESDKPRLGN